MGGWEDRRTTRLAVMSSRWSVLVPFSGGATLIGHYAESTFALCCTAARKPLDLMSALQLMVRRNEVSVEGTNQETAAVRTRGQGDPSSLICPPPECGLTGLLLGPFLKRVAITAGQHMPGDVHHAQKERFVRMIEGLCPVCEAEMKKYGLFKIMTTVRLSNAPRQCLTALMCFDI